MSATTQCPFCMGFIKGGEAERLNHVLRSHSQRLFMASAVLREMSDRSIGWETSGDRIGYRAWIDSLNAMGHDPPHVELHGEQTSVRGGWSERFNSSG